MLKDPLSEVASASGVLVLSLQRGGVGGIQRLVGAYRDALEAADLVVHLCPLDAIAGRFRKARYIFRSLRTTVTSKPYLIVVAHISLLPLGVLAGFLTGVPVVALLYGQEVWRRPSTLYKVSARRLEGAISISDYTARKFSVHWADNVPVVCIPPPAPAVTPTSQEGVGRELRALCVSRLDSREPAKNVDCVIRAVGLVREKGLDVVLSVVGDGDDLSRLREIAKHTVAPDAIEFTGSLTDVELDSKYRSAHVFVLPSEQEGFGIVYIEAMAYGLPVIAARSRAVPEVVTPSVGELVVPTPEAVAEALARMYSSPSYRELLAAAALERATSLYGRRRFFREVSSAMTRFSPSQS